MRPPWLAGPRPKRAGWETWASSSEHAKATENCAGDTQMSYEGVAFTLTDCRYWSVVQLINPQNHACHGRIQKRTCCRTGTSTTTRWNRGSAPKRGATSTTISTGDDLPREPGRPALFADPCRRPLSISCGETPCAPDKAIYQEAERHKSAACRVATASAASFLRCGFSATQKLLIARQ